jgi:3-dehydro-L-gulonate 2-dehydrogenase
MVRIPVAEARDTLETLFERLGFSPAGAALVSRLFVESSLDGVTSHGLDRVPRLVGQVRAGVVDVVAEPFCQARFGAWERWDGRRGSGQLNAHACTQRSLELAREHGLGCVALANTNHWMRGGSYAWQAVGAGFGFLGWSNTMPNLPPWGAREARVGNNPLVIGAPRGAAPLVLDMALSQFSYGRLEAAARRGEQLPVPAGYDVDGRLTMDPAAVLRSGRPLPIGFWKGSALALLLDVLGMLLAGGQASFEVERDALRETGLTQVFLAFDLARAWPDESLAGRIGAVLDDLAGALPDEGGTGARPPGERTLALRAENQRLGVPVDASVWAQICSL